MCKERREGEAGKTVAGCELGWILDCYKHYGIFELSKSVNIVFALMADYKTVVRIFTIHI